MHESMTGARAGALSLVRGRWLWATLVVLIAAAVMVRLGFWQLDRLQQRRAANAYLLSRLQEVPLVLTGQDVDPAQVEFQHATTWGTFDYSQEVLLQNRSQNEMPGADLVTPLRIYGSDSAVLVDRGWIPIDQSDPTARKAFDRPVGEVRIQGIIRQSQTRTSWIAPADPPLSPTQPRLDAWFRVDIPRLQQQVPYHLLPIYIEAGDVGVAPPPGVLPSPSPDVDLSEGPHLSYAIQWFSFATILLVGYIMYYRRSLKGR